MSGEMTERSSALANVTAMLPQAVKRSSLILWLWLPNLFLASLATIPVFYAGQALSQTGPWLQQLAGGEGLAVLLEMGAGAVSGGDMRVVTEFWRGGMLSIVLALVAVPLQWLLYNSLVGGVLARLNGGTGSYWSENRRWLGAMLRFGLLSLLLHWILFPLGFGVVMLLIEWPAGTQLVPFGLLLIYTAWLNGSFSAARASMIVLDDNSAFAAAERMFGLQVRLRSLWVGVVFWVLLSLIGVAASFLAATVQQSVGLDGGYVSLAVAVIAGLLAAFISLLRLGVSIGVARHAWRDDLPPVLTEPDSSPYFAFDGQPG